MRGLTKNEVLDSRRRYGSNKLDLQEKKEIERHAAW